MKSKSNSKGFLRHLSLYQNYFYVPWIVRLIKISNFTGYGENYFPTPHGVFLTQQLICVCRGWISDGDSFLRIVKTRLGDKRVLSRFAFPIMSWRSNTIFLLSRNAGGGGWGENWKYGEVRCSLHGLLVFLLFASYRCLLTRCRSTQIAPSISYGVVPISAPCRCLTWVTQKSFIARYLTRCL